MKMSTVGKTKVDPNTVKQFAVVQLHQGEDDYFLVTHDHKSLYDMAELYRSQIQSKIGKVPLWNVTGRFQNADRVFKTDFYRLYAQKLSGDPRITAVMIMNFDSNRISVCGNDGGLWKNYLLKDISATVYRVGRKMDLTTDEHKEQFDKLIQRKLESFFLDGDMDEDDLDMEDMEETDGISMQM